MAEALPPINAPEDKGARWIQSHLSSFQLYRELHAHLDRTFVLDDVDHLCRDPGMVKLLKCLCNTENTRRVYWATSNRDLEREGIPREFETRSKVALVINEWETVNENVGALEDRGMVLKFAPCSTEVHRQVGTWFTDKRVYNFVGDRLDRIYHPSQRLYLTASSLRSHGEDWKAWIEQKIALPGEMQIVRDLRSDKGYTCEDQRVMRFNALTGKSRASYFRVVADLKALEAANSGLASKPKMPPRRRTAQVVTPPTELGLRKAAKVTPKSTASVETKKAADGSTGGATRGRPRKAKVGDGRRAVAEVLPLVGNTGGQPGEEIVSLSMASQETTQDSGCPETGTGSPLKLAS